MSNDIELGRSSYESSNHLDLNAVNWPHASDSLQPIDRAFPHQNGRSLEAACPQEEVGATDKTRIISLDFDVEP